MTSYAATIVLLFPLLGIPSLTFGASNLECRGSIHGTVAHQGGKPWADLGLVLEPVGDYDYVLPQTKSDERGHYRFSNVCVGFWGVFVQDKDKGYPFAGRLMNEFLYGTRAPQIKITDGLWDAEFNLKAPPKPGMLSIEISTPAETNAHGPTVDVELKVNRKRSVKYGCGGLQMLPCRDFEVPPDANIRLWIMATGFRTIKWATPIRLSPGQSMKIDVRLTPK